MKKAILITGISILLSLCGRISKANGTEPGLSYLKAKQKAEMNDMKYVLYFKADWCTPCKWMEETTFQDARFLSGVDNTFIFVPLDIDAFEGYALKEYFQVYSLPTLLVFNDQHEIVNRNEGSLSAAAFEQLINEQKTLTQPASDTDISQVINTRPAPIKPTLVHESNITSEEIESETQLPAELIKSVTKYGVQLGAFSSWNNAKKIQDQASQYTTEHVEISTIPNGDKTIYKVFAGRLDTEAQAEQLSRSLSSYGMSGFVKSMVVSIKS